MYNHVFLRRSITMTQAAWTKQPHSAIFRDIHRNNRQEKDGDNPSGCVPHCSTPFLIATSIHACWIHFLHAAGRLPTPGTEGAELPIGHFLSR